MQSISPKSTESRKTLGLGWKGIAFALIVVALSLLLSVAAVDFVTAIAVS